MGFGGEKTALQMSSEVTLLDFAMAGAGNVSLVSKWHPFPYFSALLLTRVLQALVKNSALLKGNGVPLGTQLYQYQNNSSSGFMKRLLVQISHCFNWV